MPTAKELRNLAWNDLKRGGNYWSYVGAEFTFFGWTLLACVIAALPVLAVLAICGICFGWTPGEDISMSTDAPNTMTLLLMCAALTVAVVAAVAGFFWFVCWFKWGFVKLSLSCVRGSGERKEIYQGRPHAGRMLELLCWEGVYVFLWSLLLVVPGILAQLSYSQAKFLMVDHPDWTAKECIVESKRMMNGHRWRYFCFKFSFLGWFLLDALSSVMASLVSGMGRLVSFFFVPYYDCGDARFYDDLIHRQI